MRARLAVNWTNLESEGLGGGKDSLSGSLSKASKMPTQKSTIHFSFNFRDNLNPKHCNLQEVANIYCNLVFSVLLREMTEMTARCHEDGKMRRPAVQWRKLN